jgi:hypothetical protein
MEKKMEKKFEIETIKAGPKLDALVAQKVMEWKLLTITKNDAQELLNTPSNIHIHAEKLETVSRFVEGVWRDIKGTVGVELPHYSTDISTAWEVVEKMHSNGFRWAINTGLAEDPGQAHIKINIVRVESSDHEHNYAVAYTVPHAICLAALKAVGGTK